MQIAVPYMAQSIALRSTIINIERPSAIVTLATIFAAAKFANKLK